jgi:hypothetical protein
MAIIYGSEARARLYKKVEEELQPLFSKIEAAVDGRQSQLIYHNLDELQRQYPMNHGFQVYEASGVHTGINTEVVGTHWIIKW